MHALLQEAGQRRAKLETETRQQALQILDLEARLEKAKFVGVMVFFLICLFVSSLVHKPCCIWQAVYDRQVHR
jgi:hypothetical protein